MDHLLLADPKSTEMPVMQHDMHINDVVDVTELASPRGGDTNQDTLHELSLKESQSGTFDDTIEEMAQGSMSQGGSLSQGGSNSYEESQTNLMADGVEEGGNEEKTTILEEETVADEHTLNTNERTLSTYDPTVTTCEEEEGEDSSDYDEDEDDESDFTDVEEGTEITDILPLSELEMKKWTDWENKDSGCVLSPRSKKTLQEEQSRAYEKLLFYAYTALTVPLPTEIVEKSEDLDSIPIAFPPVLSPRGAELRCEAMKLLLTRLGEEGMEVLKLNRERKWQPRFLTITKEVAWFKKSDDIRYNKIDCCPQGLLWVKKFNGHSSEHSIESIGKNGKGGIMFSAIKSVSVTTDHFGLSKKQKKSKFKDSFTFVLRADFDGAKRDILFRCCNKDDIGE